ncbi:MAG: hypothetical protein ACK4WM_01905 [Thermoflexales bacterium]
MKVVLDERKLKRMATLSRIALFGSVGILFGGLLLTLFGPQLGLLTPERSGLFFLLYTLILFSGFAVSRVGFYFGNRYLSPSRPDVLLRESLKGLDRKYALLIFHPPTPYMLIEPGGVTVFVTRNQEGKVRFANGKWQRRESLLRMWLGREEALGDPLVELNAEIAKVNEWLKQRLPDLTIPVRGIIVFTHPRVVLDVEPSPVPILAADELKDYLRGAGRWKDLPASIQRKMREALGAPELTRAEHNQPK